MGEKGRVCFGVRSQEPGARRVTSKWLERDLCPVLIRASVGFSGI